jgi:hypothetical protein
LTSLTGPAPLPPLLTNPVAKPAAGTPVILTILDAQAIDRLNSSLVETLQDASSPGNIVTGTVDATSPDGTMTITTANGTSITVHHPPELPLELGSTVVLRIIPTASAPQALLLAVNGRVLLARDVAAPPLPPPSASTAMAPPAGGPPGSPALGTTAVATSFIAAISLEDESAIDALPGADQRVVGIATNQTAIEPLGQSVVAVLIRPAPARLGQIPVPSGTRYLVTVRGITGPDNAPTVAAKPPSPAAQAAIAAAPRPAGIVPAGAALPATAAAGLSFEATVPETPVSAAATVLPALQQAIGAPLPSAAPPPDEAAPSAGEEPPPPIPVTATAEPLAVDRETALSPPRDEAAGDQPPDSETAAVEPGTEARPPPVPAAAIQTSGEQGPAAPRSIGDGTGAVRSPGAGASPAVTETAPAAPAASASRAVPLPPAALPTGGQGEQDAASPPPIDDGGAFRPQMLTLAGRVVPPRAPDETLVETVLGTLALPLSAPLSTGSAVQLRVTAVATALVVPHAVSLPSVPVSAAESLGMAPPTLIEELTRALAPAGPGLAAEIQHVLAIEPGSGLAAAIIGYLTGVRSGPAARGPDMLSRRSLIDLGRTDLAARLDHAGAEIGTVRPPRGPDGWSVTVLPFLGPCSIRPMRLYRKLHRDKDAEDAAKGKPSERFMIEVELKRLGPMQFDGLVRERRFDLVIRSRAPFLPALQNLVEQVFRDGLLITGWGGEIGFGRTDKFPLIPDPEASAHLDLGA